MLSSEFSTWKVADIRVIVVGSVLGCVTLVGGYQDYLFFKNGAKTTILPIKVKFYMLEILLHQILLFFNTSW